MARTLSSARARRRACPSGLPFGITLASRCRPTRPAKIRTELLDPIRLDTDPERAGDERYVERVYRDVERRIQQGVDRLAACQASLPVFG